MGEIREIASKNLKTNKKGGKGDKKCSQREKGHGNPVVTLDKRVESKSFGGIPPRRSLLVL